MSQIEILNGCSLFIQLMLCDDDDDRVPYNDMHED